MHSGVPTLSGRASGVQINLPPAGHVLASVCACPQVCLSGYEIGRKCVCIRARKLTPAWRHARARLAQTQATKNKITKTHAVQLHAAVGLIHPLNSSTVDKTDYIKNCLFLNGKHRVR